MKTLRIAMMLTLLASALVLSSCSDDDGDDGGTDPVVPKEWHGTWLSAGDNVAPLLVAVFNYDSVRVVMRDDNTVTLSTHVIGGAWTDTEGTYSVTETGKSDVLAISLVYPAFEQEGIIQTTLGAPDVLQLEVVQTLPDIGAVPRTPTSGFGSDATLGDSNIQVYELESEITAREWHGEWLSADADVAPILVAVFNYDSVRVFMDPDNTVTLMTHVVDGAWTTTEGTYSVTETAKSGVLAVELIYPAFSQEGIIQVTTDPLQDMMQLEVVQTVPDIGAVPRTPATGFGSDATLLDTNIQVYREQ